MGCDIHGYIEQGRYYSNLDETHYYCQAELNLDRDYKLFGLLAGVRGGEDSLVWVKGLPDNLSYVVKGDWEEWQSDAHTASWLTRKEALEVLSVHQTEDMQAIVALLSVYENSRFVFWFDS